MSKDIFGGLFDFDLNGRTDAFELALGLNMVHEDEQRSKRRLRFDEDPDDDLLDDDLLDDDLMDTDD